MEWNVYYYNFNAGKIEPYNVLFGAEDFIQKLKLKFPSKEEFSKKLHSEMIYHYWSRAEWEILIFPWYTQTDEGKIKIDVFDQLKLNWDRFVEYCWNYPLA